MHLPKKHFIPFTLLLSLAIVVLSAAFPISFSCRPTAEEIASMLDRSAYFAHPEAVYWEVYNRNKPIPFDTPIWWKTDASHDSQAYVEMSLVEIIRGKGVNKMAEKRNPTNAEYLADGTEYLYLKFFFKIQSNHSAFRYSICANDFEIVNQNGSAYQNHFADGFDDDLDLFAGDEGCIELCHVIDIDDNPLAVYNGDTWFSTNTTTYAFFH